LRVRATAAGIEQFAPSEVTSVYVVVAMAAAVEHQPHKTAANYEREKDAEDHGYVAMDAQYCSRHK
jgi:hypothetical protein